jgi:hypothetical protein
MCLHTFGTLASNVGGGASTQSMAEQVSAYLLRVWRDACEVGLLVVSEVCAGDTMLEGLEKDA